MLMELIKRSFIGLGFAAIITFVFLTWMTIEQIDVPVGVIWKNMLGSMIMGIYFGISSAIFDMETWSPLKQTLMHFFLSIIVWLPLAMYLGWIPITPMALFFGIISFTGICI